MEINGFDPHYDDNKQEDVLIVGKKNHQKDSTSTYQKAEMLFSQEYGLTENIGNDEDNLSEFNVLDKIILRETASGQQKIHCWLIENTSNKRKGARSIRISRRTAKGLYGNEEVTLHHEDILKVRGYMNSIFEFTEEELRGLNFHKEKRGKIVSSEEIIELIRDNIRSESDVLNWIDHKRKKRSVERLNDIILGDYQHETEISNFFNENIWMFGKDYVTILDSNKINEKNILDVAPTTLDSFVDIIEVKLPTEKLFNWDSSHNNYYPTATLTKAIAQTLNYIHQMEYNFTLKSQNTDITVLRPFATIIIGSGEALNIEELKALRIINASYHNLKIITYQELLNRVRNAL